MRRNNLSKMDLGDYRTFCSERSQVRAHNFVASLNSGDAELGNKCVLLVDELSSDAVNFMQHELFNKAEKCYTLALKAVEAITKQNRRLPGLPYLNVANIRTNRSLATYQQGKFHESLKDAEISISINVNHTKGYYAASNAHKALLNYPKAAYYLIQALHRNLTDDFVIFMADLAILVFEIKKEDKKEFKRYKDLPINIILDLGVWTQIVVTLADCDEFEALAILTTGVCDSCCISSSVVHGLANIHGLSFAFLSIGRMLKFLADKEGTKAWHLKLAEFVSRKGANLLTVGDAYQKPFFIVMTALSIVGELPSFLSLAWERLSVLDYDQKDNQGNTALHTAAKYGKFSKPASEIVCRDLIAHGCLASEVDAAGKCPHDYYPPGSTVHNMLKNATITPDEGVRKRLAQIRDGGSKDLKEQKCDKAIELYQKALLIASKFSALNRDAAILHSNISAVHMKMEAYEEAVKYAENSLKADSTYCKGYLRLGQALLKLNNHRKACEAFIRGFHESSDDESWTYFSTEVAKILPHFPVFEISFIIKLKEVLNYSWQEKIKTLTEKAMWVEVNSLYLGPPYESYDTNTVHVRAGIMAMCDASQAVLSTIFQALDNSAINAASLLTLLIERGASPESLASSKETHFHAAVRICILTNSIHFLKFILENDKEKKIQSSKDCEGRTPLHTLCIELGRKMVDTQLCAQIATWLGENKVDFNAKDKYQRTAADYDTKLQLKSILESIQSSMLKQAKDQKPSSAESIAKCNKLKEQGNTAFKNEQYEAAYKLYSEAITVLEAQMQNPLYDLWTKEGRNLAILYGNRAECSKKLRDVKMFLANAKLSVDADGSWYKGHWRVAKACREMGKGKIATAIKAFANSMRAIKEEDGKGLEKLILVDFVETVYEQGADDRDSFKEVLKETVGYWWPQIIWHFMANKKWYMAEFVFGHCSILCGHFENLNMGVLCDKQECGQRWICTLICKFLVAGVDHKTLKFHDGDTYFHATILIILKTGVSQISRIKPMETDSVQLLQFVVMNKVVPSNELNIRDDKGNTVLHHLASLKEGHEKLREFVAHYLIEQGVDFMAMNHERKLAFDLASSSDVIKAILQHYMNNLKLIEKLKNQPKQDSYQPKQDSQPQNSRQNNLKSTEKLKSQPKQDSHPQNSRQKTGPESAPRTENPVQKPHSRCDACERKLKSAEDVPKKDKYYEVVSSLVQVSNCKNSNAAYHKGMTEKAIERIASLLAIYQPDIPSAVCKLSAKVFKVILTSLASSKHWALLEALITRFRQAKGQSALPDFAKNISLTDLIKDHSLDTKRSERMNLINLLAHGGVNLDAKSLASALEVAMIKEEWQVVIKLLEFGADPRAMTLTPGDTPYHAALQVALNRQPGYFTLLEKLKQMEDIQTTNQAHLKVSCQDSDGNTLLHIAAQAKFSPYSLQAVELLCQWNVLADIRNNENKLAIQCLPSDKDRRVQYLKSSAAGSTMPTSSKHSRIGATGSAGEELEAIPRTSAFSASWTALQVKRAEMEGTLLALPVAGINYLNLDNRAKKKVEPVESVDSNDSDEEKESDGDMDPVMETIADDEAELSAEDLNIDVKAFELLAWDIECTEDVWSILRSRKEVTNYNKNERDQGKKQRKRPMPLSLKQVIVKRVQELASGDWDKHHFQQRITDTPDSLQLFKVALPRGAYILWELAIAFSPRLSESPETVLSAEQEDTIKGGSVARGSKMYSDVIRVWSIALKHSELQHVVRKIIDSHERGKSCIIQKSLEAKNNHLYSNTSSSRHIPNLYVEIDSDKIQNGEMVTADRKRLFPPASAHKNEYHVLKFYSFSSSLASAVLNNSDKNVDFPFRVTDLEHAFINLKSESPLLLLGRSGTGKTTCCLYRMWNKFMLYWEQAINHDTPMLQRRNYIPEIADDDGELQESQTTPEGKGATNSALETAAAQQNGDSRDSQSEDSQQENAESEDDSGENAENNVFQYDHLHQLFVTKNPVLCMEVQKNFTKLYNGTEEMQRNNVWQNTDLPNTFQDMGEFSFPLFVTSRQLLLILDASLDGVPFFPRDEDLALKVTIQGWGTQEDIFNIIPLEHDLFDSDDDDDAVKGAGRPGKMKRVHALGVRPERKKFDRQECTHDVFTDIWHKITKKSKIDCHPSLVWTEIMSFIKGSYEALNTEKGYLDKTQYIKVGRKRAPNFSGDRSKVYDVFLEYQKYKQKYALFDEADLVYRLYRRLRDMPFHPWVFHEIYVDETQDFTQAELALLVSLCSEPNKMFLTGDTAQSIMRGISFRFKDLQTLFFSVKESADKSEQHLATLKVPQKVHQLRHNYRSHTGILSLASSVLDILLELFEDSFDPLKKDQGMFAGPKPIIIESSSPEDLALLLTGSRRKTSHIEFGAHQAILVVDDAAKEKLPEELGAGIVLTIFESKGLEFDDVLIYNFFKDSQAKKEWRVVTNFLNTFHEADSANNSKEGLVEIDADALAPSKSRPLAFDPNQHKVLNSELKHLYTAITRARVNVWIFDEDEEKRAPMFEYFRARGLVKSMGSQECANINEAITFADKSTSKEWRLAADKYMLQKLYTLAAKCYRYAEQPNKERVALAYQTALEASRMMRNDPRAMRDKYFKAGAQFVECGDLHRAAMCFQNSQDFLLSAIAFERNGKFEEAANQYMRAQRANDACNCLEQMGMFGRAIRLLVDSELFDRAIDCLHRYEMEVQKAKREGRVVPSVLIENKPSDVYSEANLCYRSANSHHSKGKKTEAIAAIKRLRNVDDQIQFLRDHDFWEEAAEISGVAGKTVEAALFMLRSGNTDKALDYAQQGFHKELRAFIHLTIARRHLSSDKDLEKIQANATKALQVYTELTDYNGQAQAKFLLGKHKIDPKQLSNAYRDFRKVKPPNQAGELECRIVNAEALYGVDKIKYYQEATQIINLGRNVLDVLLSKKTEDSDKYQLYMKFYGMEVDPGRHQVTWYPNLFQPCKEFLKISTTEEAKKFHTLDEADAVSALEEYLMSRIRKIYQNSQKWLEDQVLLSLPCLRMQEGQSCGDDCKYMHRPYSSAQEEIEALNKIVHSVTLDSCMHAHVQRLAAKRLKVPDMKVDALEESVWKSVERLLEFVLPTYPSFQRGQQDHTQEIVNTLRRNKDVKIQVERYLLHLWNNPGLVGKGKSTKILKERCKSVKWIVNACFFASLLNLKLDVRAEVQKLEKELMNKDVKWASKRYKYALFTEPSRKNKGLLVEAIGTRFVDSFQYLTKEENPFEAIFLFTKMVSAFGKRSELSIMPRLDQFVFWIEFYITLTWLFMAKAYHTGGNIGMFYMTNSYLFSLHIVGACTNCDDKIQLKIPQLFRQLQKLWSSKFVMERQNFFMNFLVGHNTYSDFSLIDQVNQLCQETPVRFWLAERILILSALILLNTPGQYVSADYEVPIRRELCKLSINELMPARLASLIKSLKSSANYRDVAAALFNYFHQQGSDRLLLCQLSEQKKQQPWIFIETQLSETPSMIFFEADIQAEIDKTSNKKPQHRKNDQPDNTASTELDEADRERREAQKEQIQKEKKQKEAVKKIVHLMQQNVMQKRLARKAYKTIEIDEMFKPYSLNKTSCGICGFDIQSVATDNPEEDKVKLFNELHRQDPKHIENLHSFTAFKKEYATMIHPSYQIMMRFIYENKVVENSQIYIDIERETTKVLKAQTEFEATLRKSLHSRMWSDKETLRKAFTDFHYTFQNHRQRIEAVYKEYKQTATNENNKQTGRQDKKKMEESLVELTYAETAAPNNSGLRSQFKKNDP